MFKSGRYRKSHEEASKVQSPAFSTHLKEIVYSYRGEDREPKTVRSMTFDVDEMLQHDAILLPLEKKEDVLALRASHGW
jgi:2-keto-4-pentenoate hydratase/2-oxohepta-3-ene-1,7-dioic acid hydratase in catechol pathway